MQPAEKLASVSQQQQQQQLTEQAQKTARLLPMRLPFCSLTKVSIDDELLRNS